MFPSHQELKVPTLANSSSLHLLYGFTLSFFWLYLLLISSSIPIFIYCTLYTSSIFLQRLCTGFLPCLHCCSLLIRMAHSFISFNPLLKKHVVHETFLNTDHTLPFYLLTSSNILHIFDIYINCLPCHNVSFMRRRVLVYVLSSLCPISRIR